MLLSFPDVCNDLQMKKKLKREKPQMGGKRRMRQSLRF